MALDCPICGVQIPGTASACPGCGFPVGLRHEAVRALSEDDAAPPAPPPPRAPNATRRTPVAAVRSRDSTAEACARAARELQGHLVLLRQMGGNLAPLAGGARQAALVQADGKVAESLELLRSTEEEAARALTELFSQRALELEQRAEALSKEGVEVTTAGPMEKLHAALAGSHREEAAGLVVEVDRTLGVIERDWRGLHSLMAQIEELQSGAREAGRPVPEVDEELASVRSLLARSPVTAETIDSASQVSARALMLLHEALPEILEKDLDRHGAALSAYPSAHEPSRRAKVLHSEVTRHLRRSRLNEAAKGLTELRKEIRALETLPVAPAAAPAPIALEATTTEPIAAGVPAAPVPSPSPSRPAADLDPGEALPRLLEKARSLASRVRALAPESETAFEAAGEIRRATELLRARKLEEADAALTHLMRTLDAAPPEER